MSWIDRLIQAAYTSPGGVRIEFLYEDVTQAVDKKTTGFTFPDADGTFVQDMGRSGRRYPIRVFFSGADYDLQSTAFEAALLEVGTGKLEHPIYGTVDVVPFGTISRRDNLKSAANQSIIDVVFWETIGLIYPSDQSDPASAVLQAVEEYNTAVAEEFEEVTDLDSAVERATFENFYTVLLGQADSGLGRIADAQEDVKRKFDSINDSINNSIDILIAQPLTLAFQTTQLIQTPALALVSIKARLSAYRDLALAIISGDGAVVEPGFDADASNQFHVNDLYTSTYVTGSVLSVVNNQFETKVQALEAAESILDQLDNVVAWRDANFESLGQVDTGASYQKLQEAVALTAGFLVEISFTLKQERRIVLDRNRTIIDVAAEVYGTVDPQLDFLIESNGLNGSDILELKRDREIVYYV